MHVGGDQVAEEKRLLELYRHGGEANNKYLKRCGSHMDDELRSFQWFHFVLVADSDLEGRRRHASYGVVVQLSLTSVAAVSFFCLSTSVRRYGLRRFLFLDKLYGESETVRRGYTAQLNESFYVDILGGVMEQVIRISLNNSPTLPRAFPPRFEPLESGDC